MKILLAKSFSKLTFIAPLAEGLKKKGHDVHILIPNHHKDTKPLADIGIPIHFNEIILPRMLRRKNILQDLSLFRSLVYLIKKNSFDIINLHLPAARLFGRLAALLSRTGRVVSVIHGNEIHHERLTHWIDCKTICVSHAIKNFLIDHSIPNKNIKVIHNGIDLEKSDAIGEDKYYLHRELNLPMKTKIIGMVAYFYGPSPAVHKGHRIFLDAAKVVADAYMDVHFVIIGDNRLISNERERFEAYAQEIGLADKINFLGEREDVLNLMSSLTIHVLPSLKEGFGMVILEAMARKVPNIASNLSCIKEIIDPGENGMLFEPGNHVQLSECMLKLLNNPKEAECIAQKGYQHCRDNFSAQGMIDKYEELFMEIVT